MIRELQLRRRTGPVIVGERVRVRLRRDEKVFDILRSVTFIATLRPVQSPLPMCTRELDVLAGLHACFSRYF